MRTVTVGVRALVQLLCHGGAIRRAGSVDQGTARTDFLPVERERGISVRTSTAVNKYLLFSFILSIIKIRIV